METTPILATADEIEYGGTDNEVRISHPWTVNPEDNSGRNYDASSGNRTSKGVVVFFIAVINVVTNVLMNVTLPIFGGTMVHIGGDPFVVILVSAIFFPVIFFIMIFFVKCAVNRDVKFLPDTSWKILILNGFLTTLNGILVVFASPPNRTPAYLQGILPTATIPFTVLCVLIILRKGITLGRLMCTLFVLIGLFITMEPQLWGLEGSGVSGTSTSTGIGSVIWPLIFALGFLPMGISNVIYERELKKNESKSLTFVTWTQVFQLLTILPFFWVDFIPKFGMASSFTDFWERLRTGLHCCFSLAETCNGVIGKFWLFIAGYCLGNLFQCLLIAYGEGAVYAVVVQSLVTPLATLFWTLFRFDVPNNHFFWDPRFNITTAFTIAGLVIIVPSVILYSYMTREDEREKSNNESESREGVACDL